MPRSFLSYADTFQAWLERQRALRRVALARRALEALPEDIRKDIGWLNDNPHLANPHSGSSKPALRWYINDLIARTEIPTEIPN